MRIQRVHIRVYCDTVRCRRLARFRFDGGYWCKKDLDRVKKLEPYYEMAG